MSFDVELIIQDVCAFVPDSEEDPKKVTVLLPDARTAEPLRPPKDTVPGALPQYFPFQSQEDTLPAHFPFLKFRTDDLVKGGASFLELIDDRKDVYGLWFANGLDLSISGLSDTRFSVNLEDVGTIDDLQTKGARIDPQLLQEKPAVLRERVATRLHLDRGQLKTSEVTQVDDLQTGSSVDVLWDFANEAGATKGRRTRLATKVTFKACANEKVVIERRVLGTKKKRSPLVLRPSCGKLLRLNFGNTPLEVLFDAPIDPGSHTTRDFQIYSRLSSNPQTPTFFPSDPQANGIQVDPTKAGLVSGNDVSCCHCLKGNGGG